MTSQGGAEPGSPAVARRRSIPSSVSFQCPDGDDVLRTTTPASPTTSPSKRSVHEDSEELMELRREVLKLRRIASLSSGKTVLLKEGLLMRFRETLMSTGWHERLYELRSHSDGVVYLRCLSGPAERKIRLEVALTSECRIVHEKEQDRDSGYHCFRVHMPANLGLEVAALRLGASDEDEAQTWVDALQQASGSAPSLESIVVPEKDKTTRPPPNSVARAVHKDCRESMLTSHDDGGSRRECSGAGLLNLGLLVLVSMNFRLIIENMLSHGLRFRGELAAIRDAFSMANFQCLLCLCSLPGFALVALVIELVVSNGAISSQAATHAHGFVCALCLAVPIGVIQQTQAGPAMGCFLLTMATTLFMKLISYAHTNSQLRGVIIQQIQQQGGDSKPGTASVGPNKVEYPANLTVADIGLFLCYPTLVYQTSYPRADRIRKRRLVRSVAELVGTLMLMALIAQQYIVPILDEAAVPIKRVQIVKLGERLLRLAVPTTYIWLCMFYALFHLWLNILAEVTRFGDRLFYKEWWNATNIEDYWRLWNLPVHHWLVHNVYFPCQNMGYSKSCAVFAVFFVSAVLHELLVSVPCHTFRAWAFIGMMMQMPLVRITAYIDKRLKSSFAGNVVFWMSFCITGQPLCILLYYAEFLPPDEPIAA